MAEVNQVVLKVLNHLNSKIGTGGVIDKWSDGQGNWWRKYSDGGIEQGGIGDGSSGTITFPIAFSNNRYTFLHAKTTDHNQENMGCDSYSAWNKTTTSVTVLPGTDWTKDWFACGY